MLKKYLLGLAVAAAGTQGMAYDMKALQNQCHSYENDPQMKNFTMKIGCKPSFEDVIARTEQITFTNSKWRSASIKMKDWQTQQDTGVSMGTAQTFPCKIYERVAIQGPNLNFHVNSCDQLTEEYVSARCTGLVKDACKDGQCTTQVVEVISNTCELYNQ